MLRQRTQMLIGLGAAIVALLLLASGLSGLTFRPGHFYDLTARMPVMGEARPPRPLDPASLALWQMLVSIVSLVLLIYNRYIQELTRLFERVRYGGAAWASMMSARPSPA